jgi:hypothetical protein
MGRNWPARATQPNDTNGSIDIYQALDLDSLYSQALPLEFHYLNYLQYEVNFTINKFIDANSPTK